MDASKYYQVALADVVARLFPGALVEIQAFPGVGIWPYVVGPDGEEVSDQAIAAALAPLRNDTNLPKHERIAVLSTRDCLKSILGE